MRRLTLFIDADDTLLDFDAAETRAITQTFEDYDLLKYDNIIERYKVNNLKAWKMFEVNEIERDDISTMRFKWLFDEYGITGIDLHKINDLYWSYLAQGADVIEGAREFLEKVKNDYDLYVITNGTAFIQDSRFKLSDMSKYFKKRYISENLNTRKPEKAFFEYIKKDIGGIDYENSYIVGDSLSSDIQCGINSGIKTIWFNRENKQNTKNIIPNYEVKSFEELYDLVETIRKA